MAFGSGHFIHSKRLHSYSSGGSYCNDSDQVDQWRKRHIIEEDENNLAKNLKGRGV